MMTPVALMTGRSEPRAPTPGPPAAASIGAHADLASAGRLPGRRARTRSAPAQRMRRGRAKVCSSADRRAVERSIAGIIEIRHAEYSAYRTCASERTCATRVALPERINGRGGQPGRNASHLLRSRSACSASPVGRARASVVDDRIGRHLAGLLMFFRVDDFEMSLKRARALVARLEEEPHANPNTRTEEFSLRDPDGYYVTISSLTSLEAVPRTT